MNDYSLGKVMAAGVFFSYSHADELLRDQIEIQLSTLKRQGIIQTWHDRRIIAGEKFANVIEQHVEMADIILLLVSADFIASDYCYDIEMQRAMQRHQAGEAIVIPVILRACDWRGTPFDGLNSTPPDGKPITQYPDRDQGFLEVAKAVRAAVSKLASKAPRPATSQFVGVLCNPQPIVIASPRSSNLALSKTFTDLEKDRFKHDSFKYIALFFENSLNELAARNPGIEVSFRQTDASHFEALIYKQGKIASECTIFLGNGSTFTNGIAYHAARKSINNGFNDLLNVDADDQSMFLSAMGMSTLGSGRDVSKLTQEGAAEFYWGLFIARLRAR
jgi:TIR domain